MWGSCLSELPMIFIILFLCLMISTHMTSQFSELSCLDLSFVAANYSFNKTVECHYSISVMIFIGCKFLHVIHSSACLGFYLFLMWIAKKKKGKKIALRWTRRNLESSSLFGFTLVIFSDWERDLNTAAYSVHVAFQLIYSYYIMGSYLL